MRRLTLTMMAIAISLVSFAQGNITYVLNGGVTNDSTWQNKNDMYMGLNKSWNAFKGTTTTWTSLDSLIAKNGNAATAVSRGIPTEAGAMDLTFIQDETVAAQWQWLVDYMDAVCTAQGKTLPSTNASFLRYNLSAFFLNSVYTSWPKSADYTTAGTIEAFQSTWKHGFAGPATYVADETVVLPTPYKEGETFLGWYTTSDFSGDKVTEISGTGDVTVYAKFGEYIPTIAEALAVSIGDSTKTQGVVTYQDGKNVWIQDASGAILVYFATAPTLNENALITVKGARATYRGNEQLAGAYLTASEAGTAVTPTTTTMAAIMADTTGYLAKLVYIEGLKVASYTADSYVSLTDGIYTMLGYKVLTDMAAFPVGTRVNATFVVNNNNGVLQFRGYAKNIVTAPLAGLDPYVYPARGDGAYTLTNRWLFSNVLDNLSANKIANTNYARGMAAVDGKMYFPDRENKRLVVVDGTTGEMLDPIALASDIFTYTLYAGTDTAQTVTAGTLPFNDIKVDGAGHVLLGNCITSNAGVFQIWKIDLTTGAGTLVLQEILKENPDFAGTTIRFDAFGVYGDVDGDAIIMAQNANAFEAYRWEIKNGVAANATLVEEDISTDENLKEETNPGSAPQIFPIDETYFYLDGNATFPTLFDNEGNWVDGFQKKYALLKPVDNEGDTCKMNVGHNGICEFQIGDEYFVVMAGTNTAGQPASTFVLYKYKDASKVFADMTPLWYFPAAGMGSASNAYRTAVPSVEVSGAKATIYLYTGENGYGVYEFTGVASGLKETSNAANLTVSAEGILSETVAYAEVYTVTGQQVFAGQNVHAISVPNQGAYILHAVKANGEKAIVKFIVR